MGPLLMLSFIVGVAEATFRHIPESYQDSNPADGNDYTEILTRFQIIESRLEESENVNRYQNEELARLRGIIRQQSEKIRRYDALLAEQEQTIQQQRQELQSQQEEIVALRGRAIPTENASILKHEKDYSTHVFDASSRYVRYSIEDPFRRKIKRQKRLADIPIAFQAALTPQHVSHIAMEQPIPFDKTITNVGLGYNNQTGVFVAPVSGLYLFQASVSSWRFAPQGEINAYITVNGNTYVGILAKSADNRHNQGCNVAIVELMQGDRVWVKNTNVADETILGHSYTSFSGMLLHRITSGQN